MLKFLQQPYPFEIVLKKHFVRHFWIGCFIAFFLIIFQPFGTNLWVTDYKIWKLLGYGVVSFVMPVLFTVAYFSAVKPEDVEQKWTVGKEIIAMVAMLFSVAIGNLVYAVSLGILALKFSSFVSTLLTVVMLGVFPLAASIFLNYSRYKALNEKEACILEENLQVFQQKNNVENTEINDVISLVAENEKDSISLNINDLQYIESADNYANIVFLQGNKIQKELLRGTLKRFENQISHPFVQRCHRSFIVNLNQVAHISGNAQGYRITLKNSDTVIPVARNYGASILEKLKK